MKKQNISWQEGMEIFVLDSWGSKAGVTECEVTLVHQKKHVFDIIMYGDLYQKLHMEDFNLLFFLEYEDAKKALKKLPVNGQTVFIIKDNKIIETKIDHYGSTVDYLHDFYDVWMVFFNKAFPNTSIKELNKSVFLSKEKAMKSLKNDIIK